MAVAEQIRTIFRKLLIRDLSNVGFGEYAEAVLDAIADGKQKSDKRLASEARAAQAKAFPRLRKLYEGVNLASSDSSRISERKRGEQIASSVLNGKIMLRTEDNGKWGWNRVVWHYADYLYVSLGKEWAEKIEKLLGENESAE
ncbi:MAG: hypothetical protein QXZ09_06980 [Candidatus Methanomethylicaceae archaeon]